MAAWSEPKKLPPMGGQAQIIVRASKRGGRPFEGVEVRVRTSAGSLFSQGKVLVTDASGRTRDRRGVSVTASAARCYFKWALLDSNQ